MHYVDYGNEDDLLANDLRAPIKNELFSLPFQVSSSINYIPYLLD